MGQAMPIEVLLVDDDDQLLRMEQLVLERAGYHCTLTANATEARECLRRSSFQLALVDVQMPGESGLDLARFMRAEFPQIAALMVTGVDDLDVVDSALMAGVYGYVIKPFKANDLLISVANAQFRHKLERENLAYQEMLQQVISQRTRSLEQKEALLSEARFRIALRSRPSG
jgi:DNA-binding NtrC family response regulator